MLRKRWSDRRFAIITILPAFILVFGIVLYPLIQTFIYSLKNMELTSASKGQFVGIHNYVEALTDSSVWEALGRTAYFASFSIALELVLGLLAALLLNENIRGIGFLRSIIILPWAVPTIVNAAMWKWIYHPEYGALNGLLAQLHLIDAYRPWLSSPWTAMNMVILADVWKMTPFVCIFFLASLQMTNKSVYEAASIDGAGLFRRLIVLTLPYLKPTVLVLIVMRTMESFKVFDLIYALTKGGPTNGTMVIIYKAYLEAFTNLQFSQGATLSYLIALFIAALTFAYVKVLKAEGGI
ncbi:sugar ABC transporter permease [Paenibacillus sp. HWE-109]|uniref:carbohydrate ABC transporter permease n=1 Tax=Paenibacillus sp. HWE-109 TaxID=1306526 RepID=UPI001EDFBE9A|nr:sugar ABC transporter permease [Paenibacillus sp. HWE-109]UKS23844.1 sugar ABC transporter permease [Paenibacillus sp. HWE-109]